MARANGLDGTLVTAASIAAGAVALQCGANPSRESAYTLVSAIAGSSSTTRILACVGMAQNSTGPVPLATGLRNRTQRQGDLRFASSYHGAIASGALCLQQCDISGAQ